MAGVLQSAGGARAGLHKLSTVARHCGGFHAIAWQRLATLADRMDVRYVDFRGVRGGMRLEPAKRTLKT
jgi:hypothetical protein